MPSKREQQTIKQLQKKRDTLKGNLTRFHNYVKEIQNVAKENILSTHVHCELESRLERMQPLLNEFEDIQSQINNITDEYDSDDNNEYVDVETVYFSCIGIAKALLKQNANEQVGVNDNRSERSHNSSVASAVIVSNNHHQSCGSSIKLPTIKLPKFSGGYEHWLEFRDTFSSLIHSNTDIGEIQKFHYLKASLEGNAAQVISNIEVSAVNYSVAWNLICDRFDNKNLMVHNHVKSIFNVPQLTKESHKDLRLLSDTISKHLRSLAVLEQPTNYWDTLLLYIVCSKLDPVTAREWEEFKSSTELLKWEDMKEFLKSRADLLEKLEMRTTENSKPKVLATKDRRGDSISLVTTDMSCPICKESHAIYHCKEFLKMPVNTRVENVKRLKLCINCLRSGHFSKDCFRGRCQKCSNKHSTLLHFQSANTSNEPTENATSNSNDSQTVSNCGISIRMCHVLLSTALVNVLDAKGKLQICRILLDSGSQSNFITESYLKRLGLPTSRVNFSVLGINQTSSNLNSLCKVEIHSRHNSFAVNVNCLVVPKITECLPNTKVELSRIAIPSHIKLADPTFGNPEPIDVLLGAGVFWDLLCVGQVKLGANQPIAQKTKLGWVISGPFNHHSPTSNKVHCNLAQFQEVQNQLVKFWEIEEISSESSLSSEEKACEAHFKNTFRRDPNGRFIVAIPLKDSLSKLGESKALAVRRFYSMERKLQSNPELREAYTAFMQEYESLNHMTKINENNEVKHEFYFPHHGVLREESLTTKLRVVFDGSAPSETGISFNDLQMVGPTIQNDLLSILLRFRSHTYVVTADIAKMYRQVLIKDEFKDLHRIVWRYSPNDELSVYRLNTVTYGTSSAPFLAIRCLKQLSLEASSEYPKAANVISQDFYVDDMLTGSDNIDELKTICHQVSIILQGGCFKLRKWSSNNSELLQELQTSISNSETLSFNNASAKTLGLRWSCVEDTFQYKISDYRIGKTTTKRSIISDISQIFDPLGLLSPCVIIAKILLQKLWLLKLSWDESVPQDVYTTWSRFRTSLVSLNTICIPRHVMCKENVLIELHGFCDASQDAYGACIYIRSINCEGEAFTSLLCAKGKVAPLKSITIPRLELCGALLLARMFRVVKSAIKHEISKHFFWTDSTIVLGWIHTEPNLLQTFVSNRVSEIQQLTNPNDWRHVPTETNPADIVSRGCNPDVLKTSDMWWFGPEWLKTQELWPVFSTVNVTDLPEIRRKVQTCVIVNHCEAFPFHRFSNLMRLQRTIAYCLRFITNCKKPKIERNVSVLSAYELRESLNVLVKISQRESFPDDLKDLTKNRTVNSKSRLLSLAPFLDKDGIIRVGGRLQQSPFDFDKKHPMVLSSKHKLTRLIFQYEHKRLLHPGPQLLLASIRDRFWPIFGRNLAKRTVHECVKCTRFNAKQEFPIMGNLPKSRVTPLSPFLITGVDYAGPFNLKDRKGRGCKISKGYICLFICMSVKAIHLELVSDLSTQAFIATLRRFVSRRGKPSHIYSDNGTNFVGANSALKELGQFLLNNSNSLSEEIAIEGITWHFIPAHSPNFGGLWESGVKTTKHHLKRVTSNANLTFEEMLTILTQIECVVNSRPITPLSCDPNDMEALTPAHFLIGRPLSTIPDPDVTNIPEGRLSRYQYLQQMNQHFWTRWSKEYVSELQQRVKWRKTKHNLREGTMVIVKDDNLPPARWILGRVVQLHPGPDNVVRVASIKTASGVIKRGLAKICLLPIEESSE